VAGRRTDGHVEVQRAACYGRLSLADDADRLWRQIIPTASRQLVATSGSGRRATRSPPRGRENPERAVELARQASARGGD
jgi:hypothetical protein